MEQTRITMVIQPQDNVAVAIENIAAGELAKAADELIPANQAIPRGHKIARQDIAAGQPIIKYNHVIGRANQDIKKGDWVHCHNVDDITEELEAEAQQKTYEKVMAQEDHAIKPYRTAPKLSRDKIMAYRRPNGEIGVRNHVLVISIIQCANLAAQKIAEATGAIAITQEGGCLEFPDRLERLIQGFVCAGTHPNTYSVLVVSLGCQQMKPDWIVDPIRESGREVHQLCMQTDGGFHKVVAEGTKLVKQMQAKAQNEVRVPCPISEIIMTAHCGGSDWTSGLSANPVCGGLLDIHEAVGGTIVAGGGRGNQITRCGNHKVFRQMMEIGDKFRADCKLRNGKGMSEVNPTPGNKAGGLTTLEEKNLGTHESTGHALIHGFIEVGERAPGPGTWDIDQCHGNNDSYGCTGSAMSGAHFIVFTTGRGTMLGNACAPTIKLTGNQETYDNMSEFFDYCAAPVLRGEKTLEQASIELYELMLDFAEGKPTASEILGDYSWTIPHAKSLNGDYPAAPPTCAARE